MGVIVLILFLGIIVLIIGAINDRNNADLKRQYNNDLANGNKSKALISGRAYYKSKRGSGELTIYDEQAITNDLLTMRNRNDRNATNLRRNRTDFF